MGINRVQQAVEEYERVVKKAAQIYEDTLRKAEADLRTSMSSNEPEPPSQDTVTMNKVDYDNLQKQLKVVAEFIKNNPNLNIPN